EATKRTARPPAPTGVPGLPPRVAHICQRCLVTDPIERPTADQVATELVAALAENRPSSGSHRRPSRAAAAAIIALAGAVALAAAGFAAGGPREANPPSAGATTVHQPERTAVQAGPGSPGPTTPVPAVATSVPSAARTSPATRTPTPSPAVLTVAQAV